MTTTSRCLSVSKGGSVFMLLCALLNPRWYQFEQLNCRLSVAKDDCESPVSKRLLSGGIKELPKRVPQWESQESYRLNLPKHLVLNKNPSQWSPGCQDLLADLLVNALKPESHNARKNNRPAFAGTEHQLPGIAVSAVVNLKNLEVNRRAISLLERDRHVVGMIKEPTVGSSEGISFCK
ncbi:MAG: hypothetical protein VYD81_09055 [Planctomycetota bacterium]|nr:hypothetical protein [Planctomycetota bacterium]